MLNPNLVYYWIHGNNVTLNHYKYLKKTSPMVGSGVHKSYSGHGLATMKSAARGGHTKLHRGGLTLAPWFSESKHQNHQNLVILILSSVFS